MQASSTPPSSESTTETKPSNASPPRSSTASFSPEVIQALTPIVLALLGALIGCLALIVPPDKSTAALGLAGTAIAGAAGLAKSGGSSTK